MSRARRWVAAVAAAAAVVCAGAGTAQAADGDLFFERCTTRVVAAPCVAGTPSFPLGITRSPEGSHLYAAMQAIGSGFHGLQIFDRDPATGVVTARTGTASCFKANGAAGACTALPAGFSTALAGTEITVSPDGQNVYLVASSSLFNFARNPGTGGLVFLNCVGTANGCADLTQNHTVQSAAVSPDSANVYLRTANGLAVLDRAGDLTVTQKSPGLGCFAEVEVAGCVAADGVGSATTSELTVSPDGANVYLASSNPGGIAIFRRAADGTLTQPFGATGGCFTTNGASGGTAGRCRQGGSPFAGATTIAATSTSVYVGSPTAVISLSRGAGGLLEPLGCYGPAGCLATSPPLAGTSDIAVTPDASEVIVAATNTILSFQRAGSGALTRRPGARGCVATGAAGPCTVLSRLTANMRLSIDPVRHEFTVSGQANGMLATITRDFAPVCETRSVDTLVNTAVNVPLVCTDANGDPLTLQRLTPPAAGQTTDIVNGSVFYNPVGGFLGQDSFTYGATSHRGVASAPATIGINVVSPPPIPNPNPGGVDGDRDGFFAGQDCNDGNAQIRPGATELKGNRIDENCDGLADPFPTLSSGVVTRWSASGTRLTLTTLQVTQQFPKGWKAQIRCSGSRCPFRTKSLKAGKVTRGTSNIISALTRSQRRFRAGQTVEVWVSAPGFNTTVKRYVLKKGRIPTTQPFCVIPGQTRPQKTCT